VVRRRNRKSGKNNHRPWAPDIVGAKQRYVKLFLRWRFEEGKVVKGGGYLQDGEEFLMLFGVLWKERRLVVGVPIALMGPQETPFEELSGSAMLVIETQEDPDEPALAEATTRLSGVFPVRQSVGSEMRWDEDESLASPGRKGQGSHYRRGVSRARGGQAG
jgi:hypothetical protein